MMTETGDFVTDFNARRLERLHKGFPPPENCHWILVDDSGTETTIDFGARPCLVFDSDMDHWSVWIDGDGVVQACHLRDEWKPTYDVVDLLRTAKVWCSLQMLGEFDPSDPPKQNARPDHSATYWRSRCPVTDDDIREAGDLGDPDVIGDCPEADAAIVEWALREGVDRDDLDHGLIMVDWVINNLATWLDRPAQDVLDGIIAIRRGLA